MQDIGERLKQLVRIFRRESHHLLDSERTTVYGADAMLTVLQLVMAQVNKQQGGEFRAALSDVLLAWKRLLVDKLGLRPLDDEVAPGQGRDVILEAYEAFLKRSNAVDLVHVLTMCRQLRDHSDLPGDLVNPVELYEFLADSTEVSAAPSTPPAKSRACNWQVKSAVRSVFCSYLSLLVNAKDDLALARTLDVPSRALGRQTFTDVRHAAGRTGMSLFLAVTSFVRAIQLGGKGYAPAPSDPLRKHIKGLSAYVRFLDNLEDILGETADPSVCGSKLVRAIRGALVKAYDSGDVCAAAQEIAKQLEEEICKLHRVQKDSAHAAGTGISPARPKAHAVNRATAYAGRESVKVLLALLDEEAAAQPCANKADLLSEDRPGLDGSRGTSVVTLFRSPEVSKGSSPEPLKKRAQSRPDPLKPKSSHEISRFANLDRTASHPIPVCLHLPEGGRTAPQPRSALPELEPSAHLRASGTQSQKRRRARSRTFRGPASGQGRRQPAPSSEEDGKEEEAGRCGK
ncbi:PCNA-interacting partner isoform X2 [Hippocampus zosterae]|uniref:PCNA-interacting partner isoform X2 n=1 Tax=Hippocampus zosterae TaxID=109293 RepID=UPI00223CA7E1|nr:PCNA-interacting partner isoform X2 [Hippocampus zosterae]